MKFRIKALQVIIAILFLELAPLACLKTEPVPSPSTTPGPVELLPTTDIKGAISTPFVSPSPLITSPAPTSIAITSPVPSATPTPSPTPIPPPPSPTSPEARPSLQIVASGLEVPWALAFAPDGRLFFTERPGRVRVIQQGRLLEEPVARLNVAAVGEGGLLGMALDPDFQANGFLYVYYTYRDSDGSLKNRVERLTIRENRARESKVLLEGIPGHTFHDGGRIKFGPDGKLYVTTGDARNPQLSQDLGSLAGKILRLNPDGTIPGDNPFQGSAIYSYGHRNPQGLAWQPQTNFLFSTEHGSSAHDEVNLIRAGSNYGWPLITGMEASPGLIPPLLESRTDTWAPSGMAFYKGAAFPQWQGNLFFTALKGQHLQRLVLSGQDVTLQEKLFPGELGRLRDVVLGPDGYLYFNSSNKDGRGFVRPGDDHIYRLAPR